MIFFIYYVKSGFLKILLSVLSFIYITNPALATEANPLFRSDDIIKMELRSDFSAIQNDRGENPQYHEGELIYRTAEGETIKLSVKLTVRGNFRRNPAYCNFPPLFLNFKKSEVTNTLFSNQDKLKLVTPCQYDEDVIKEYLIYKMYNQITDLSLKARLVKIVYFDTGINKEVFEKFSFFIEDKDQAAARNDAFIKDRVITPFDIEKENFRKLSVFQYIIGNKDWFVSSRKNILIMQPKDSTKSPYAVPYDFDFAAIVNADYTKPKEAVDIFPSRRRVYKGLCYTDAEYEEVFDYYRELRSVFISIIKNQKNIPAESRNQIIIFINQFYASIKSSETIEQEFKAVCETKKDYNIAEQKF